MKEKIVLRKLWNKKKIASLLIASFIISNAPVTDWNKYIYTIKADEYDFSEWNEGYEPSYENKQKVGVNVAYHTEDEIREFVKNHPFVYILYLSSKIQLLLSYHQLQNLVNNVLQQTL